MILLKNFRPAKPKDYTEISDLIKLAFECTDFGYHHEAEVISDARKDLTEKDYLELVAEDKGKIIAYILLTHVALGHKKGAAIAPLVVHPDYQNQGIGESMISVAETYSLNTDHGFLCAVGQPEYFGRFGFFSGDLYSIKPIFKGVPPEMFVFKEIIPKYLENNHETPKYLPAFYHAEFEDTFDQKTKMNILKKNKN